MQGLVLCRRPEQCYGKCKGPELGLSMARGTEELTGTSSTTWLCHLVLPQTLPQCWRVGLLDCSLCTRGSGVAFSPRFNCCECLWSGQMCLSGSTYDRHGRLVTACPHALTGGNCIPEE